MLGDISSVEHIYIACGHTDMRKSIDGLCFLVQQKFKMDPTKVCFYSAAGNMTGLKHYYLKVMVLYFYIKDWKMVNSSGRIPPKKYWI